MWLCSALPYLLQIITCRLSLSNGALNQTPPRESMLTCFRRGPKEHDGALPSRQQSDRVIAAELGAPETRALSEET